MSPSVSTPVFAFDEIEPGTARKVDVAGIAVSVVRIDDDVYAIGDVCTHAEISLSGGEVWCDEREIECPKHGSAFSLLTGEPATLPATQPVPVFGAAVVDGQVVVTVTLDSDENHQNEKDTS
jgi:3-phenylpropionate/trans-cinnamate dioxygenase ferredoxin subunit